MTSWTPTESQVSYVKDLFAKHVPTSYPNRDQFWANVRACSSNESLSTVITTLKAMPLIVARPVYQAPVLPTPPVLPELASEPGLYRDPSDGTLYRLTLPKPANQWTKPEAYVSTYSNKAVYRRLTPEGRMVKKGKWTRLRAQESRLMLGYSRWEKQGQREPGKKVLASWLMSEEAKLEWAVGFCMFCNKGLIDAVSVFNNIGPDCADKYHIDRQIPPEL